MNGFGWTNSPESNDFWAKVHENPPVEDKCKTSNQIVYEVF